MTNIKFLNDEEMWYCELLQGVANIDNRINKNITAVREHDYNLRVMLVKELVSIRERIRAEGGDIDIELNNILEV